jgi:hypothetical protein
LRTRIRSKPASSSLHFKGLAQEAIKRQIFKENYFLIVGVESALEFLQLVLLTFETHEF